MPSTALSGLISETGGVRRRRRQRWLAVHLWLGLTLGAVFVLLGLTGSVLCFYPEIDLWLNPGQRPSAPVAAPALQPVLDALRAERPDYAGAWRLEMPLAAGRPINARYYRPPETAQRGFAPYMATVDPATAAVSSGRYWGDYAMTWIYDLHYTLLLGPAGRTAVGVAGIAALVSLLSGLWLWWPAAGRRREALRLTIRRGRVRALYDGHVLAGVYGGLVLAALCVSGALLALPEYLNPLVAAFSAPTRPPAPVSGAAAGRVPISVDAAIAAAGQRLPGATLRWVETPADAAGSYRVNFWQPGEPGYRFPRTNVWVDAYDGRVLAVRDWPALSGGDVFLAWQHPLHNGEAFGLPGRILACLAGLLPALLWVTGLLRWRRKRQARQQTARRRQPSEAVEGGRA